MKTLFFLLFLAILTKIEARTISKTLYINKGTFRTVKNTTFPVLAFNETNVFNPKNAVIQLNTEDSLQLSIINNDTTAHGFAIKGIGSINAIIFPTDTVTLTLRFPNEQVYIYYDPTAQPKYSYIGLAGMICISNRVNIKKFHWQLQAHDSIFNYDLDRGRPVIWANYEPNYFTINGLSHPDLQKDTTAVVKASVGDTVHIFIANTGQSTHSIHFHGFHCKILHSTFDNRQHNRIKDTFPINSMQSLVLELVPDKTGQYSVHDHNLVAVSGGNTHPNGMFLIMDMGALKLDTLLEQRAEQHTEDNLVVLRSNTGSHTLSDNLTIPIFGFAPKLSLPPTLPAKIIECNEGDTVTLNAWNVSQNDEHTIHLHGLDVDTRHDGDPATSFYLKHMMDTTYSFVARHAGTYLYHCHVGDVVHVQMGMYGLVIVKAKNGAKTAWTDGPAYNKEYAWLTSEIDRRWHENIPKHLHDSLGNMIMEFDIPRYTPTHYLINGKSKQQLNDSATAIKGSVGENIYLRLANIGFYNNQIIFPSSLNTLIIDSDGRPLPQAIRSDTVTISPGERYGIMLKPSQLLNETIAVQYLNMNTHSVGGVENVPITIDSVNTLEYKTLKSTVPNLYPNPNDGNSIILNKQIYKIRIIDLLGRVLVENGNIVAHQNITIDLPNGMYYIELYNSEYQVIGNKKLVISK